MSIPSRSQKVWYNNSLREQNELGFISNRAFRYGDGLIETIRMMRGELLFFHDHIERMQAGMQALMIMPPSHWDARFFYECISRVLMENNYDSAARIRIQVWRTGEGLYAPNEQGVNFYIEATEAGDEYMFSENGLVADVSKSVKKIYDRIANVKSSSALSYVIAAHEAKQKKVDVMFVLNERNAIADAPGKNVFIIERGKVVTPPLTDACVAGVFRHQLIELLRSHKIVALQESITQERLGEADEIFLTNVMESIQPVSNFQHKTYSTQQTQELFRLFRNYLMNTTA